MLSFAFVSSSPSSAYEDTPCAASKQETRELKVKTGDLERQLATARKEADDIKKADRRKSDVAKLKTELDTCRTEKSEQEDKEQMCKEKSARAVAKLGQVNRQLRVTGKNKTRCEGQKEVIEAELRALEKANGGGSACGEAAGADADALGERLSNCEETVKAVRERCDRDSADLKRIEKTHDRIRTNLDGCRESLTACEGARDHLEFLKKGYDVIVQQMEKETKDAKEDKDKSESSAKEAIKGQTQDAICK